MLNPSLPQLLIGVADALAADVLNELPAGPARDQAQAAIAIVRRVARALPIFPAYLLEDIADVASTLKELAGQDHTIPDGVVLPEALTLEPLDELIGLNLRLREQLAGVAARTDLSETAEATLAQVLRRMTDREATLRQSPWER